MSLLDKLSTVLSVSQITLQNLALTSIFICSKFDENDAVVPSRHKLASITNIAPNSIIRMEREILILLDWNLKMASPIDFIQVFLSCGLIFESDSIMSKT